MTIQPGTVSHGTMRPEDLIPAFLDVLPADRRDALESEYSDIVLWVQGVEPLTPPTDEDISWFLNEVLFDALNELAPHGYYFGAHPGDGADYGFWMHEELECDECGSLLDYDTVNSYLEIGEPQERYLCSDCAEEGEE
jgi:hypothetical protein